MDWIHLVQDRDQRQAFVNTVVNVDVVIVIAKILVSVFS